MAVMRLLLRNLPSLEFKELASLHISPANYCSDLGETFFLLFPQSFYVMSIKIILITVN